MRYIIVILLLCTMVIPQETNYQKYRKLIKEKRVTITLKRTKKKNYLPLGYALMKIAKQAGIPVMKKHSDRYAYDAMREKIKPVVAKNELLKDLLDRVCKDNNIYYFVKMEGIYFHDIPKLEKRKLIFLDTVKREDELSKWHDENTIPAMNQGLEPPNIPEKYQHIHRDVAVYFVVSEDCVSAIGVEGVENNWPLPGGGTAGIPKNSKKLTGIDRKINIFLAVLRAYGLDENAVKTARRGREFLDYEVDVIVSKIAWNLNSKQVRQNVALQFWKAWATVLKIEDVSKARIRILNEDEEVLGGSKGGDGSMIWVKE